MAFFERYLTSAILLCAGLFLLVAPRARGEPEPATLFRTLALGADVAEVFYDLRGKPVPVASVAAGFSPAYEAPSGGKVVFYRLLPPETPEGKPRRVTVAETHMNEAGPYLVFVASKPEAPDEIAIQVVNDAWDVHPAETIRVFNFSRRDVAVRIVIKDLVAELAPGKDRVLPYAATGQFWMQAATMEKDGWVMRVSAPQVAPPKTRITAILFDQKPSPDRPVTHELDLVKYIDVVPPPPAP